MRKLGLISIFAGIITPLLVVLHAAALNVPPTPTDIPIVDQANVLTDQQKQDLAQKIANESTATSNQIGILIIPTLAGDSLEDYSIRVARQWGIGTKERNNGVLLLVAVQDRKLRIEVGYGLEGSLTDARSSQIIRDRITPQFKNNNYYGGVDAGIDGIISAIHNEYDPQLQSTTTSSSSAFGALFEFIIFGLFIIPSWIGAMLARTKSWWAGGVIGGLVGVAVSVFVGFLFIGLASIVGLFLLGLLFDRAVSKNYSSRKSQGLAPNWWAGGSYIGGGGGKGGFGGFSGGSFGGGGSSGSW